MGAVPSSAAIVVGQDLPDPVSYQGQHIIPLQVDADAWLEFHGISYWLAPFADASFPPVPEGQCYISLFSEGNLELSCAVYDASGERISIHDVTDTNDPAPAFTLHLASKLNGPGGVVWNDIVKGSSLTFQLNYHGSENVRDVIIPLHFTETVARALDKRRLCFRLENRPVTSTGLRTQNRRRSEPKTPMIYLHGYEDPVTGFETPGNRLPPHSLTRQRVAAAWQIAKTTGRFDPAVFPNITGGEDEAAQAGIMQAIRDLDEATVVEQVIGGSRLVVHRAESGGYTYRFLPAPERCEPALVLVEYYRLSSFPARYGAGRTIKTFSLLPGEQTSIRVSTYKRSAESLQKTASILDSATSESESEFARTVNSEQSNQSSSSKGFEYRAEAEAEGKANWGWGSASARVSGGVSGSSNSGREEFAKSLTNAVSQNTARASSQRDVQIDTSMDVKLEAGEEQAIERTLENINVSRTLNFVFRQMNQEFITLLHLVDVRVAFFNGHAESRDEVPLSELDRLLRDCLRPEKVAEVRAGILRELRSITDLHGEAQPDFLRTVSLENSALENPGAMQIMAATSPVKTGPSLPHRPEDGGGLKPVTDMPTPGGETGGGTDEHPPHDDGPADETGGEDPQPTSYEQVDPDFTSTYTGPDGRELTVRGILLSVDRNVLRTDGVVVESLLGEGDALDAYSVGLQEQDVRAKRLENDHQELENDRMRLALQLLERGDASGVQLYQRLFPLPQVVNQIDHAAINSVNGRGAADPAESRDEKR